MCVILPITWILTADTRGSSWLSVVCAVVFLRTGSRGVNSFCKIAVCLDNHLFNSNIAVCVHSLAF